jgi:hypothetical protein
MTNHRINVRSSDPLSLGLPKHPTSNGTRFDVQRWMFSLLGPLFWVPSAGKPVATIRLA